MSHNLPYTKKYLLESLDRQSDKDCNVEFLQSLGYVVEEKSDSGDSDNILYGSSKGFGGMSPEAASAALYVAGKGLKKAADFADSGGLLTQTGVWAGSKLLDQIPGIKNIPIIGDAAKLIASGAVTPAPGLMGAALRNLAAQTGSDWFEANIKNIGHSQNVLAAQGAGKPWTPLIVPDEDNTAPETSESKKEKAIQAAQREERAKKYRKLGYKIP